MFHIISRQHFGAKKEFHSTVPKLYTEIDIYQYFFPPSPIFSLSTCVSTTFLLLSPANDHLNNGAAFLNVFLDL